MDPYNPHQITAWLVSSMVWLAPGLAFANTDGDASPSPEGDDEPSHVDAEPLAHPLAWQFRLAYERTTLRLHRVGFSGLAEAPYTWSIRYDSDGLPVRLVTHGVGLQANLVYQPYDIPLQLVAGVQLGLGFAAPDPYETNTGEVVAQPDPDQLATVVRGAIPFGLRVPLGAFAVRAQMSPGLVMVSVDEVTRSSQGFATGSSVGMAESVRGQLGFDFAPFDMPVGVTTDLGYDFGRLGGWSIAAGIAYLGAPR